MRWIHIKELFPSRFLIFKYNTYLNDLLKTALTYDTVRL